MRCIDNAFHKQYVVFGVVFIVQEGELAELWATRGHVHVSDGSLEAGALWRRLEGHHNVVVVVLVYQDQ